MREDPWLAERMGRPAITVDGDDDPEIAVAGFLQTRVPASDVPRVSALERAGWSVVDVTVTLSREPGFEPPDDDWTIRAPAADDRDALLAIAHDDYDVSRFHLDPLVPDAVARRIKRDWLAACLDGERGDGVLVADGADGPAGFLATLTSATARVIDLVAVSSVNRGSGVGRALVTHLLAESSTTVEVGTQIANVGALRFYESLGFRSRDTRYVLHCHR